MEPSEMSDEAEQYAIALGDRLRNVRQQQRLSLHDVETRSDGELKASVVGAYERGERALSVSRLRAMADFYRVPVSSLLPSATPTVQPVADGTLVLDLTRLDAQGATALDRDVITRYVSAIQAQRGDYNGRMLTVRASDVRALAAVLDTDEDELRRELVGAGVARQR
jgi:transcriptional regulator with XRE-family HTH domain